MNDLRGNSMDNLLSIATVCTMAVALLLASGLHRRYLQARLQQVRSSPHRMRRRWYP